jgi:hypothetical protein
LAGDPEEAPLVRIADTLDHIAGLLEKMANPVIMVRGNVETVEFGPEGAKITPY